jgi:hypothetical protein
VTSTQSHRKKILAKQRIAVKDYFPKSVSKNGDKFFKRLRGGYEDVKRKIENLV